MHATYLYLFGPQAIESIAARVELFRNSREAFDSYLTAHWGKPRPYTHAQFVVDLASRKAGSREVYYLADALKDEKPRAEICMDFYLDNLFLDCEDIARREDENPGALPAFFRSLGMFRVGKPGTETFLSRLLRERGLPDACIQDILLLNQLCSSQNGPALDSNRRRADSFAGKFPLWILAGWDHYQGFLTGAEFSALSADNPDGFISLYRRALEGCADTFGNFYSYRVGLIDRFLDAHGQAVAQGGESICVAIDGN